MFILYCIFECINRLASLQNGWRLVKAEMYIELVNVETWLAAGERCKVVGAETFSCIRLINGTRGHQTAGSEEERGHLFRCHGLILLNHLNVAITYPYSDFLM